MTVSHMASLSKKYHKVKICIGGKFNCFSKSKYSMRPNLMESSYYYRPRCRAATPFSRRFTTGDKKAPPEADVVAGERKGDFSPPAGHNKSKEDGFNGPFVPQNEGFPMNKSL